MRLLESPLSDAAEVEDLEEIQMLLEEGLDPNGPPGTDPPIFGAMSSDDPKCLKALLAAGADPNRLDTSGRSPLSWAMECCAVAIRPLVEAGAHTEDVVAEYEHLGARNADIDSLEKAASTTDQGWPSVFGSDRMMAKVFSGATRKDGTYVSAARMKEIAHAANRSGTFDEKAFDRLIAEEQEKKGSG